MSAVQRLFGPSTQNSGNFDLQLSLQCVLLGTEMLMIKPPHPQPGPSFSPTERANRLNWGRQSTRRGSVWVCWASDNKGPRLRFKDNKDVYHLRISNLVDPARPHCTRGGGPDQQPTNQSRINNATG